MASQKELSYIIRAVDEASKNLKTIKGSLDDLGKEGTKTGRTLTAAFGFFSREAGQDLKMFGTMILSTVNTFTSAAQDSVNQTRQLNQVLRSTKGVVGLTADEIQRMATSLSQVTNFEDDTILRGQNMLLTFTKIGKDVFPLATEAMLNMAQAMGTDVKSQAIQLGKALNDPINGLDALTRVGVQFTDQQKSMIKEMAAAGDIAGAQKLILQELETEFGGVARATADAKTVMANSFGEIQEGIGKTLLPAFDSAAKALLPVLQNVATWIAQNPQLVQTIALVAAAVGGLLAVMGTLIVTLATVSVSLAALGVTLAMGGALALALVGITSLIVVLTQHWEGLKWMVGNAIDFIVEEVTAWAEDFKNLFILIGQYIYDGVMGGINKVKTEFTSFFELIRFQLNSLTTGAQNLYGSSMQGPQPTYEENQSRAAGGPAGGWTRVGEHGPELVKLPRGSYVNNARATEGMMGGDSVVFTAPMVGEVHVHNEADEDRLVQKMQAALVRTIQLQQLQAA